MSQLSNRLLVNLPKLLAGLVLLIVVAALVWFIKSMIDGTRAPKKPQVQQISLVKPPPPKPPEEKPPEPKPPEIKDEVKVPEPVPQAQPTPTNEPPPQAGLEPGPANGMQTDLAAGGGLVIGGGGGGSRARWYAGLVADRIENVINRDPELVKQLKGKRPVVRVWVDDNGRVERVECENDVASDLREQLKERILNLTLTERPEGISQPIWYRLKIRT